MYNQPTKRLSNSVEIPIIGLGVYKMTNPEETHNLCLKFAENPASIMYKKMLINKA